MAQIFNETPIIRPKARWDVFVHKTPSAAGRPTLLSHGQNIAPSPTERQVSSEWSLISYADKVGMHEGRTDAHDGQKRAERTRDFPLLVLSLCSRFEKKLRSHLKFKSSPDCLTPRLLGQGLSALFQEGRGRVCQRGMEVSELGIVWRVNRFHG